MEAVHKPNWLFFSGVYLGLSLVAFAIGYVLVLVFDVDPPSIMGLAVFALASHIAGKRYADSTGYGWSRDDRHRLAIGYSGLALVLSTVLSAPLLFIPALGGGVLPLGEPIFLILMAIVLPLYAWAQYGIARWAFGQIMKYTPKGGAAQ